MAGELNYYHSDLYDIDSSGLCYAIKIKNDNIFIIKKDELIGVSVSGQQIKFYFKNFPSISTRLPYNDDKLLKKITEFIKKELKKEDEEIDL
jgi:hypothetical protein